jgi:membrane glycosyltransferase
VALGVGALAVWLIPAMYPWLLLVLIGPLLSIPFSRVVASNRLGQSSRRHGWFLVPEETQPPWELRQLQEPFEVFGAQGAAASDLPEDFGLAQVVVDPRLNSIHVSLLHERQQVPIRTHDHLMSLCNQLLVAGPKALSPQDKRILLWDADSILTLHRKLWGSPARELHPWWRNAFNRFLGTLPPGAAASPASSEFQMQEAS